MRDIGCALPQPAFAATEEVWYAHERRLQLRARFLRHIAPRPCRGVSAPIDRVFVRKERDMRSMPECAFDDMNGVDVLQKRRLVWRGRK